MRLHGTVCVVTGASRGAERGIAHVLGEEGATVYVTGRTTRGRPVVSDVPHSIEETAEEVTACRVHSNLYLARRQLDISFAHLFTPIPSPNRSSLFASSLNNMIFT
jgi:NAD(P)-dependent dehydrogenase (short-subunit alcohol dehydrogenase family)